MPQPTGYSLPGHRTSNSAANDESNARRSVWIYVRRQKMNYQSACTDATTVPNSVREVVAGAQPVLS